MGGDANPAFLDPDRGTTLPRRARASTVATPVDPRADALFRAVDKDGSGYVSFGEFARWFGRKQLRLTGEMNESVLRRLKELWDQYDVDESGDLDPQEFSAILIDLSMIT